MAKKKSTSKERALRREVEILKAQIKTEVNRPVFIEKSEVSMKKVDSGFMTRVELPIKEIRKDLIKTTIFAVFAIGILVTLSFYPINL